MPPLSEALCPTVLLPRDSLTPAELGRPCASLFPEVGSVVGRYFLVAWQGVGSAGVVFRAIHTTLDIPVAVKMLRRDRFPDPLLAFEHLRAEAYLLARIQHPHVVRLWDFHDDPERPYLVTEYVHGPTLGEVIRSEGRMQPRRALRVVVQTLDALEAVWRFGAIHRDVKPDNLILAPDGTAKLIDLGLAKPVGDGFFPGRVLTSPAEWAGTPAYLAPEQARTGVDADYRADIYSLGVTLYEAVTGRLPFAAKTMAQMILRHREDDPLPPVRIVPELGKPLSDLILRMMAKDPRGRFEAAAELREAIAAVAGRTEAVICSETESVLGTDNAMSKSH